VASSPLAALTAGWIATAFYLGGYDTIPESRRYAIEFELFLALALVEAIRLGVRHAIPPCACAPSVPR